MIVSNFHSHTKFSDGSHSHEDYVLAAIEAGFEQYGFSDHAVLPFDCKWTMPPANLRPSIEAFKEVQKKYEGKIQLFYSLEVDYIPGKIGVSNYKHLKSEGIFPYSVGSIHFVDQFEDQTAWSYERIGAKFDKALTEIFGGNIQKLVERYFELYCWMMRFDCPDILGHFDKIKVHNKTQEYFKEDADWYQAAVHRVLDQAKKSNCIIEVNVRGKYKGLVDDFYPSDWILHEINKRDIPLTVSSDAHSPSDLRLCWDELEVLLKDIGFNKYYLRNENSWEGRKF